MIYTVKLELKMNVARMRNIAFSIVITALSVMTPNICTAKDPAAARIAPKDSAAKESAAPKNVRCAGVLLRMDYGHPDRMAEMSVEPDSVLADCIDSGKFKGLVEAFDAYFQLVDSEFGDAAKRDPIRLRLNQVFKSVSKDPARSAQLLEGFRKFSFASVLAQKGLTGRAIEEVRQSRLAFLRAVPPDSFCIMPIELYLATALADTGETDEAVQIAQGVVSRSRSAFGPKDEFVGLALAGLGKAQMAAGKPNLAEAALRESMGILADVPEIQPIAYLLNCQILAEAFVAQSKFEEAAELMSHLEPEIRKLLHDQLVPPVFSVVMLRAKSLNALERYDEAEKVLGRFPNLILSVKEPGPTGRDLLKVYSTLLEQTDRKDQAASIRKTIARIDAKLASAKK